MWRKTCASIFAAMMIGSVFTDALADLIPKRDDIISFNVSDLEKLKSEVLSSVKINYDKKIYRINQIKEELKKMSVRILI